MKLGNAVEQDFSTIFDAVRDRGLRVPSTRLPKCRSCDWVAECAGSCRAGAYFSYGTLDHEDDCCPSHHNGMLLALEFRARGYDEPADRRGELHFELEHAGTMTAPIGQPHDGLHAPARSCGSCSGGGCGRR